MRSVTTGLLIFASMFAGIFTGSEALGHCEIPCGIYGDRTRVDLMKEHCQTIEKSMREIRELEVADAKDVNQMVRWVTNKDAHANKIQHIVYQYFMNQRVKPVEKSDADAYEQYVTQITLLHRMLVTSMKCKQTTDETHVKHLRTFLADFEKAYFTEGTYEHSH
jgi:nickel superoxide dismutase